jgi:hypothetical protein
MFIISQIKRSLDQRGYRRIIFNNKYFRSQNLILQLQANGSHFPQSTNSRQKKQATISMTIFYG